jgi:spermidine synthase
MSSRKDKSQLWITEQLALGEIYQYFVSKILFQTKSSFQDICIVELLNKSKALLLDRQLQSTSADEFMYHEPLVHVPFISHKNPENVLIIGAGEGAAAREALKWASVKELTLIDIDKSVVDSCVKYLPEMSQGAFKNKKVKLIFSDIRDFLKENKQLYDVIICDLCDEIHGKKDSIIKHSFLVDCKNFLKLNGYMCIQSGEMPFRKDKNFESYIELLKNIFGNIKIFCSWVPSFCRNWAFVLLRKDEDFEIIKEIEVEKLIEKNIKKDLLFLNHKTYTGLFSQPKYVQEYEK